MAAERAHASQPPQEPARAHTPLLEKFIAALGALALVLTLGYLVWSAASGHAQSPDPVVEVEGVEQQGERFLVRVRVHNRGAGTAEDLRLVGRVLGPAGIVLEESRTEFQYLPGESSREAGLYFRHDPRGGRLAWRAESYQQP